MDQEERLRVGVSACLTGAAVRFDGGHCHDDLVQMLGRFADLVPVCPEVALGLGVPRETLRLERRDGLVSLRAPRSGRDLTEAMEQWAATKAAELAAMGLDGYVVKRASPTCGFERVRVYGENGVATRDGQGLFTRALIAADPLLVVEEDGRLRDDVLRESFFVRLFARRRLRLLFARRFTIGELVALHASLKLELMARSPAAYRALGQLVAHAKERPARQLADEYARGVMDALAHVPSRGRHVNVMQHLAGYVVGALPAGERRELHALIDDYRDGREPRSAPLALIRHHARRQERAYVLQQSYLDTSASQVAFRGAA